MTKLIPFFRAVALAAAVTGVRLLVFAAPATAYSPSLKSGGENTPLTLSPSTSSTPAGTGGASLTRTIVGLAIVLAVIWGLWWVLRQVKNGREPSAGQSEGLASVAALTLSAGRSVHLVRAGSDYLLIGVAEQGLMPIHRYSEEQARAAGLPLQDDDARARPRRALLAGVLGAATGTSDASGGSRTPVAPGSSRGPGSRSPSSGNDPMRMPSPTSGVVERLREWTVRR
jgi:flagellar protein FliO/FliZ